MLKIINRVFLVAIFIILLFFTRFQAISWNDNSRFATIQNLVEQKSFMIEHTLFYTGDKVFINGHFFSDKPPLFSIVASLPYAVLHTLGAKFVDHPRTLVYCTNFFALSLPFVLYFFALYILLKKYTTLNKEKIILLINSLAVGTALLPFATVLNNHLPAAMLVGLASVALFYLPLNKKALAFGTAFILGLATTYDLGVAFISLAFFVFFLLLTWQDNQTIKNEKIKTICLFILGGLIPGIIHWLINRTITGDIFPASMHPEFFNYPGSQFTTDNLTSAGLAVSSFKEWTKYVYLMTFGQRGFFLHNPVVIFGFITACYYTIKSKQTKLRLYSATTIISTLAVVMYYSLWGKGAGGGAYTTRWFIPLIPLFFPIIITWVEENITKRLPTIIVVCLLSLAINFPAVGNVLGSKNHYENYHVVNMYRAFPKYFSKQIVNWQEILGIKK